MKTIFLLLVFLFFAQTNCLAQYNLSKREKQYYKEIISLYPDSLVSHLPKNIDNRKTGAPGLLFPRGKYLSYIHLTLSYKDKKIERLKKEIASKAKGVYHFGDSCLILPYDYEKFEIIKSDSIRNLPFTDMLPIPNFSSWEGGFSPEVHKKAVVYLLDAKKGKFLADDCLSKCGVGLPEEWKHGYTRGVFFYKNYVEYWLEVW